MSDQSSQTAQTICLAILASIASASALYWLKPVMIPFILSILLAYLLSPLVSLLQTRLKLPGGIAIVGSLLVCSLVFYGLILLIASSISELSENSSKYQTKVGQMIDDISQWLQLRGFDIDAQTMKTKLANMNWGETAGDLANGLIAFLSNTFLILIFAIYLLQGQSVDQTDDNASPVRQKIEGRIKRYLTIKIALSAATGILTAIILMTLGVDAALLFGILAFLLNFIPSVGSVIATLLPVPLVLFEPTLSGTTVLLTILLPATVHIVIGNVLEPKIMGDSLELHPITILLSLVFWGMLWGVPGMLLAVPISATICVLLDSQSGTKRLAKLMAGQSN